MSPTPLTLSPSLEGRRAELSAAIRRGGEILAAFAGRHGWAALVAEPFHDAASVFDRFEDYRDDLLRRLGLPAETPFPRTYSASLEGRLLAAVSPEVYRENFPAGDGPEAWARLVAHECAHRLHVRILSGDEERMGPIWFYEGFAVVAAGQFEGFGTDLPAEPLIRAARSPERGDYRLYGEIVRRLMVATSLPDLVEQAAGPDFTERAIIHM